MNTRHKITSPPFQTGGQDIPESTPPAGWLRFFKVTSINNSAIDGGLSNILSCIACLDNGDVSGGFVANTSSGSYTIVAAPGSVHNVGDIIAATQLPGGTCRVYSGTAPLAWVEITIQNAALIYATDTVADYGGQYTGYQWNPRVAPGAGYQISLDGSSKYQTNAIEGEIALAGSQAISIINPLDAQVGGAAIWSLPLNIPLIGFRGPLQADGLTPTYFAPYRSDVVTALRNNSGTIQSFTAAAGWTDLFGPWVSSFTGSVSGGDLTAVMSDGSTVSLA